MFYITLFFLYKFSFPNPQKSSAKEELRRRQLEAPEMPGSSLDGSHRVCHGTHEYLTGLLRHCCYGTRIGVCAPISVQVIYGYNNHSSLTVTGYEDLLSVTM